MPEGLEDCCEHFDRCGFWKGPRVFDESQIKHLRAIVTEILDGTYSTGIEPSVVGWNADRLLRNLRLLPGDLGSQIAGRLQKIENSHISNESLWDFISHRELTHTAQQLMAVKRLRLWQDKIFLKPPANGSPFNIVDWHQDYHWWRCVAPPNLLTAWIPLQDVTEEDGALQVVVGSHKWGWNREFVNFANFNRKEQEDRIRSNMPDGESFEKATLSVQAGQPIFMNCLTIHGSGQNLGVDPRLAYVVVYQASDCCWKSEPDTDRLHFAPAEMRRIGSSPGSPFCGPLWPYIDEARHRYFKEGPLGIL